MNRNYQFSNLVNRLLTRTETSAFPEHYLILNSFYKWSKNSCINDSQVVERWSNGVNTTLASASSQFVITLRIESDYLDIIFSNWNNIFFLFFRRVYWYTTVTNDMLRSHETLLLAVSYQDQFLYDRPHELFYNSPRCILQDFLAIVQVSRLKTPYFWWWNIYMMNLKTGWKRLSLRIANYLEN